MYKILYSLLALALFCPCFADPDILSNEPETLESEPKQDNKLKQILEDIDQDTETTPNSDLQNTTTNYAKDEYPIVVIQVLNKTTAHSETVKVRLNQSSNVGRLKLYPISCHKSRPEDPHECKVFLKVKELPPGENTEKELFSGWMSARRPAFAGINHPIYDVVIKDCEKDAGAKPAEKPETDIKR